MFDDLSRRASTRHNVNRSGYRPSALLLVVGGMCIGAAGICWLAVHRSRGERRRSSSLSLEHARASGEQPRADSRPRTAARPATAQSVSAPADERVVDPAVDPEDILADAGIDLRRRDDDADEVLMRGPVTQDSSVLEAAYADRLDDSGSEPDALESSDVEELLRR